MTFSIHSSPVTHDIDSLWIDGLSENSEWMLWIFPEPSGLDAVQCAAIVDAFQNLRGCVWFMSPGKGTSRRLRDYRRALGQYPGLVDTTILQATFDYITEQATFYSDIGLINRNDLSSLARFLLDGRGGLDRAMVFLPDSSEVLDLWSMFIQSLAWICSTNTITKAYERYIMDSESIIKSVVQMTGDIGGIIAFPWRGHASDVGLVFLGRQSIIQSARQQLADVAPEMTLAEFMKWFEYGVYSLAR
jgi:hypothetical protein